MNFKALTMDHRALRTYCEPFDLDKENPVPLANKLKMALSRMEGYGLAANQIGCNKRMFAWRIDGKFEIVVNPTIAEVDDDMWSFQEGCLSIPGFWWNVERPKRIDLRGFNIKGEEILVETTLTEARIFQHEMDHMDGKLVIDLISEEELAEFTAKWEKRKKK